MVRITLMDGSTQELKRSEVRGIFPWRAPLRNPHLRRDGVIYHRGVLYPVHGPLAPEAEASGPVSDRPWFLLCDGYARVIRGLPAFNDDIALGIVPARERPEPTAPVVELVRSEAAPTPSLVASGSTLSEEEEEAKLLKELEGLLPTG